MIEFDPSKYTITGSWETRATGGGIWAQGGIASDGTSLYATTGNTVNTGGTWQDGEAVIRLRAGLAHSTSTKDYFTPSDWLTLDEDDLDGSEALSFTVSTGTSGTVSRAIALGKDGYAYLVDTANLGGISTGLDRLKVSNSVIITEPTIYHTPTDTKITFTNFNGAKSSCSGNNLTMLRVTSATKGGLSLYWCVPLNGGGAPILTTTDGIHNPIGWVLGAQGDNQLHGVYVTTGKTVFDGNGITMNGLHRFGTLIAANKHLYVVGDGAVYAFAF